MWATKTSDSAQRVRVVGDHVVVRAPACPLEIAQALFAAADPYAFLSQLLGDQAIASAICSASPSLAQQIERLRQGLDVSRTALLKIASYILRMTTRSTPFGALAGVGIARLGDAVSLELRSSRVVGFKGESSPPVSSEPEVFFNDLLVERPARVSISAPREKGSGYAVVHIRNTPALAHVREKARESCTADSLADSLVRELHLSPQRADTFVRALRDTGVLLSRASEDGGGRVPQSNQLIHAFAGVFGLGVFEDAAILARVATRLSRRRDLQAFAETFVRRYEGVDRLIPLMELIDPERGIGLPRLAFEPVLEAHRQELMRLILTAARDGCTEIELDEEGVERLCGGAPLPPHDVIFDLPFVVLAKSLEDVQHGAYVVAHAGCPPVNHAGRLVARFATNLGPEGVAHYATSSREQAVADVIHADIMFTPTDARVFGLSDRPRVFEHTIDVALRSGGSANRLAIDDLFVSCDGTRFHLHSRSLGREIVPHHCSMLNTEVAAPEVVRFLTAISDQYAIQPFSVDWRVLPPAPMVPRLRFRRAVLAPAQWNVPLHEFDYGDAERFQRQLRAFAAQWHLPETFAIVETDRQLTIDRTSTIGIDILRNMAQRKREPVLAVDATALDQGWLRGPGGSYAAEVVATLRVGAGGAVRVSRPDVLHVAESARAVLPGSTWTYLWLGCGKDAQDTMIRDRLRPFIAMLRERGDLETWHFIRYADEVPHLRIRLRGEGRVLVDRALEFARETYEAGLAFDASLRTYVRELERYGGAPGMACAEELFAASSDAVCEALATRPADVSERIRRSVETFLPLALALDSDCGSFHRGTRGGDPVERGVSRETARALVEAGRLAQADERVAGLATKYREVVSAEHFQRICDAFMHLHCNRIGLDRSGEQQVRVLFGQVWRGVKSRKELVARV